jgi:hypothetical protein
MIPGKSIPENWGGRRGWLCVFDNYSRVVGSKEGLAKFLKACSLNSRTIADEVIE